MELGELTDDAITADYRVYQRRRGHRYSIDDVATAWEAVNAVGKTDVGRYCDLGCGIASVLLMVSYKLPQAQVFGVEAQDISFELARRNVERNGLEKRVSLVKGDFRDAGTQAALPGEFDLITGTPSYLPSNMGTPSPDPQRAHARMELRGGVEDYLATASKLGRPGATVVVCMDTRAPERVERGAADAGLSIVRRRDVVPRVGKPGAATNPALFTVWTLRVGSTDTPFVHEPDLIARDARGARTAEANDLRCFFGLPIHANEPPGP